jgi:hypothetical protein
MKAWIGSAARKATHHCLPHLSDDTLMRCNMLDFLNLKKLGGRKPVPTLERFHLSYIPEALTGCWLWLGGPCGSNGYGTIKVEKKHVMAHRYSYEIHKGKIPNGMIVMHSCDTPLCVNPLHLSVGTHQDNQDDKKSKGRQARGKRLAKAQNNYIRCGENSPTHKLTQEQVNEIRNLNLSQRKIAELFATTQANISNIKRGKTWNFQT